MFERAKQVRQGREGSVAVFIGLSLTGMLSLMSIAFDIGHLRVRANELQAVVDAAAYAGAQGLNESGTAARTNATSVAIANLVGGQHLQLEDSDIELGNWDEETGTFVESADEDATAVRITKTVEGTYIFYAKVMGFSEFAVTKSATAGLYGGGSPGTGQDGECGWPNCGIITLDEIDVPGTAFTDSWDYTANSVYNENNATSEAGICSNGDINITGTADINGDVAWGPEGSVDISGSALINGQVYGMSNEFVFETDGLIPSNIATVNDNADLDTAYYTDSTKKIAVTGSGKTFQTKGGNYYVEQMSIGGGSNTWLVNGSANSTGNTVTTVYINKKATLNGSSITGSDPSKLVIILMCDDDVDVQCGITLDGSQPFYGTIIAPWADVKFTGTATIYGQIIAENVDFTGTADLHFPLGMDQYVDWCAGIGSSDSAGGVAMLE